MITSPDRPTRPNRGRRALYIVRTAWTAIGFLLLLSAMGEITLRAKRAITGDARQDSWLTVPFDHPYADSAWFRVFSATGDHTYIHDPYRSWRLEPVDSPFRVIDSQGNRRTIQYAAAAKPVRRVLLLGGSVTWGTAARDSATIPSFISKELAASGLEGVEIVNLAQPFYNFTQEAATLLLELANGARPDAIVFLDGVDDIALTLRDGEPGHAEFELRNKLLFADGWYGALFREDLSTLLEHSQLYQRLFPAEGVVPRRGEASLRACRELASYYVHMSRALKGAAATVSAPVLFVRQPHPSERRSPLPSWERAWMPDTGAVACARELDSGMSSLGAAEFLTLGTIFNSSSDSANYFMARTGEFTEAANARVAAAIAPRVASMIGQSAP